MADASDRRRQRIDLAKERCLTRVERCVGRLPREAISAVDDLIGELERIRATPDDDLDDTVVGRRKS